MLTRWGWIGWQIEAADGSADMLQAAMDAANKEVSPHPPPTGTRCAPPTPGDPLNPPNASKIPRSAVPPAICVSTTRAVRPRMLLACTTRKGGHAPPLPDGNSSRTVLYPGGCPASGVSVVHS